MCKTAVLHEADFISLPPKLLAMSRDLSELGGGCCFHLLGSHLPLLLPTIGSHLPPMSVLRGRTLHLWCCLPSVHEFHPLQIEMLKKGVYFCALAHMSRVKILMLAGSVAHTFNPSTQQERQRQADLWDRSQFCLHGELQALQSYTVRLYLRRGGGERGNVKCSEKFSFIIAPWIMECNDYMTFMSC